MGCHSSKKKKKMLLGIFFLSVYSLYDITAYVYLQYMNTSRQGVHLLEVLSPWLMQHNILILRSGL